MLLGMQCKSCLDGELKLQSHHVHLQEGALQNVKQDFGSNAVSAV